MNNESIPDKDLSKEAYCKGCYSYFVPVYCRIMPKHGEEICPCVECLIKGICQIRCHEFKVYYSPTKDHRCHITKKE